MSATATKVKTATLTANDIKLLRGRDRLKAELKRLDAHLKPRISAAIDELGAGRVMVGASMVELRRSARLSVSWAALATALLAADVIASQRESFTVEHTIDSCKVVEA